MKQRVQGPERHELRDDGQRGGLDHRAQKQHDVGVPHTRAWTVQLATSLDAIPFKKRGFKEGSSALDDVAGNVFQALPQTLHHLDLARELLHGGAPHTLVVHLFQSHFGALPVGGEDLAE